jgi:predicted Zn finger-like uncharacterized protein
MIITCDTCQTRYNLPEGAVPAEGRRVRCKNCGHEWVQFPDPDDKLEEKLPDAPSAHEGRGARPVREAETASYDTIPHSIPEGVRPEEDKGDLPALIARLGRGGLAERLKGYAAAACLFALVLTGLCAGRDAVATAWPPATGLYNFLGLPAQGRGAGLVFEDVRAVSAPNAQGVSVLHISGRIGNMRNRAVRIPAIRTELRRADGSVADSWRIAAPSPGIGANAELPFNMNYPEVPADVHDVRLTFALGGRAAVAAAPQPSE